MAGLVEQGLDRGRLREYLGGLLDDVRDVELDAIASSVDQSALVVVEGEAECGKTRLLGRYASLKQSPPVVAIDLDGAYSLPALVWQWHRANARTIAGDIAFSHATALPSPMWPAATRRGVLAVDERLGPAGKIAFASQPPDDLAEKELDELLSAAIGTTCALAADDRGVVCMIDHLEAPRLTPRHPVRLGELLWRLRAAAQQTRRVRVLLACRTGLRDVISGPDAAFFQDGRWVTLARPARIAWRELATGQSSLTQPQLAQVLDLTGGHVPTTLDLLSELLTSHGPSRAPATVFDDLARSQGLHAARCVQHARSLDRLGGHLLLAIAQGRGPYEASSASTPRDIARATNRLRLAGLIERVERGRWILINPLVAHLLAASHPLSDPATSAP